MWQHHIIIIIRHAPSVRSTSSTTSQPVKNLVMLTRPEQSRPWPRPQCQGQGHKIWP